MIRIFELLAFAVSTAAFGYGAFKLFRKGVPKLFQLYVCATGCYMLEELWVIVDSLFGTIGQDELLSVRLFGLFGCFCFMLSANANGFDKVVDENRSRKARISAHLAPIVLLTLYAFFAFSPRRERSASAAVAGLISISPALIGAWFSLKHLFLPKDTMGFLTLTRGIDILALVFYAVNYVYPLANLYLPKTVMGICDLLISGLLLVLVILCRKEADRWKTLI